MPGAERLPRYFECSEQAKKEAIEILDAKRAELLQSLEEVRNTVTQAQINQLILIDERSPQKLLRSHSAEPRTGDAAETSPEIVELMRHEQQRLETLRRAMKEEIQGLLRDEMRKQENEKEKKQKELKYQERLAAMAEVRDIQRQKREKEIQMKQDKKAALINDKERKLRELKVELELKMKDKMQKVDEKKKIILEIKHKEAEAFAHKLETAKQSIIAKNHAKEQEALSKFVQLVQKLDHISERKKHQELLVHKTAQKKAQVYSSKIALGKEIAVKQSQEKIDVYIEENARFEKARVQAEERKSEQIQALIDKHKKKADQARSLTERAKQEVKEQLKAVKEEFAKKKDGFPMRQQLATAVTQRARDDRVVHQLIAEENRKRLIRARSYEVDKRLALIDMQNAKSEIFKEQKHKLNEERGRTLVKSWIEKSHLLQQIDKLKNSANNEKLFARLVKNLGISANEEGYALND